jgi:hemoglobin
MRTVLAVVLLAAAGGLTRADDKPIDRTELDKRIVGVVYESAKLGTDIFNNDKNYEGCYRLYQGTLMTLVPLLDHRSVLQGKVKMRLERAADGLKTGKWKAADAAFELRVALDEVQNEIAPSKDKKAVGKLWDRLGGEKNVRALVHDVVLAAAENPKVNFTRGKKLDAKSVEALEESLVRFVSSVTGGPLKYEGKSMKDAHAGMKITHAEFDALVGVVKESLAKFKVPEAETKELVALVESTRKDIVESGK